MADPRIPRRAMVAALATASALSLLTTCAAPAPPAGEGDVSRIHFLIPGSAGGGWDLSARSTGAALTRLGLIERASYENMSGGGGGRAMAHLVETSRRQHGTLMIASSTMLIQSLRGVSPISFFDLTPVASLIGDYGAFVVRADSPYATWDQVVAAMRADPAAIRVAGGSVRGSLDHVVVLLAVSVAGLDPAQLRYVSYDTGGKALVGLLSGETELLSTGLGESLEPMRSGQVRILALTAPERLEEAPGLPTLRELGYEVEFVNWRGFFGPPTLPPERADAYAELLGELVRSEDWEQVRRRHGWVSLYRVRSDFVHFLHEQADELRDVLASLGRPPRS